MVAYILTILILLGITVTIGLKVPLPSHETTVTLLDGSRQVGSATAPRWPFVFGIPAVVVAALYLIAATRIQGKLRLAQASSGPPVLSISDALQVRKQQSADIPSPLIPGTRRRINRINLWRISVTNNTEGTEALEVRVKVEAEPPISPFPVTLHRMNDNHDPYAQTHRLACGEPFTFDFLGYGVSALLGYGPKVLLIYRADSGSRLIAFPIPEDETAARLSGDGIKFKVSVFVEPPARSTMRSFLVKSVPDGSTLEVTSLL